MHIFSIFGRLYHISCETDMHIFSCLGRLYHINSQIFVYAFAPGRVYINAFLLKFKNVNVPDLRSVGGVSQPNFDGYEAECFVNLIICNFLGVNICVSSSQIGCAC